MLFVLSVIILLGILAALGNLLVNLAHFTGLTAVEPPADGTLVSVLVPARNEARCIERCIRSLLAQDYPRLEVIVLDDCSEDGTGEILRAINDPRLRVIGGSPLPAGWVGKNWACHQLSQAARGEFLHFIDADTEHAPGTISAAVAMADRERASLVSAWPRLAMISLGEQLIIPMIVFFGMTFYPHALFVRLQRYPLAMRRVSRRLLRYLGAANGQSLLFRRSAYDTIGGHAALRDHLVEDVGLGREVASRIGDGLRLINCEAQNFSTCRMYHSLAETWSGFTKNSRAVFEGNVAGFYAAGFAQFVFFLLPFFLLAVPGTTRVLAGLSVAGIYLLRSILAWRFRTSWLSVLLHPIGQLLTLGIGLNSAIRSTFGGVQWKGRSYTLSTSPPAGS